MTVKELIDKLKEFDQEAQVMRMDSEFDESLLYEVFQESGFVYLS